MCSQILMRGPFMIAIGRKSYSTKNRCRNRIFNSTALVSIFGLISLPNVTRVLPMNQDAFSKSTDKSFKTSKPNR